MLSVIGGRSSGGLNQYFHSLANRWRDYLKTHGAVPGTVERRKVFHDQLPPGHARQSLPALHRYVKRNEQPKFDKSDAIMVETETKHQQWIQ